MHTRLFLVLIPFLLVSGEISGQTVEENTSALNSTGSQSVLTILETTEHLGKSVKDALIKAVRRFPKDHRWSVTEGGKIYAIATAVIPEPDSDRIAIQTLKIAELRAVNELFVSKGLLDHYAKSGLDDISVLKKAVRFAASSMAFQGSTTLATKMSVVVDEWAIALAITDEKTLVEKLTVDAVLDDIRNAYRNILHETMRKSMMKKDWDDAAAIWKHCSKRALFTPDLFIDAAQVEIERKNETVALTILQTAFVKYRDHTDDSFFEAVGKLLEPINTPAAQSLAKESYQRAISLILRGQTTQ